MIVKFADDSYVGSTKRYTISTELDHITEWAKQNNFRRNAAKTSEMIISKRGKELSSPLPGIKRVKSMVILGITIIDDLRASNHVDRVIASCRESMHVRPQSYQVPWSTGRCTPYGHQGHHYRPTAMCLPCVVGPYHRKRPRSSGRTLYEDQTHGLPS